MQTILDQLKIKAKVVASENNGTITRHYLQLIPGTKVSKIENCATEIALGLKAYGKPIIKVIPEQGIVCIEALTKPIDRIDFNYFNGYFKTGIIKKFGNLPVVLGKKHDGKDLIIDITSMPHLLVGGSTGSGKSTLLHSIICSLIKNSGDIKLALIDPKQVELSYYENVRNLFYPVITNHEDALEVLSDLREEMVGRFDLFRRAGVNNIINFNAEKRKKIPYVVLVIDEFSDLMYTYKKEFQLRVGSLAKQGRACGIHLVIATQHPSAATITGEIKANFPARISCKVSSLMDSRVILDQGSAERLIGKGDAIINANGFDMIRFHGAFIGVDEIEWLCEENKRKVSLFKYIKELF